MSRVTAKAILDTMRGWVGLSRSKGTHKVIIDTYNAYKPLARSYKVSYTDSYCATTVSAAFIKNDAVDMLGGTECSVEKYIDIFKKKGIWNEDGTIVPKAGHIICYNWDDTVQPNNGYADHIGIVEKVDGNKITVIEGNIKGDVGRRVIEVGNGYIRGYAIPDYISETVVEEEPKTQKFLKKGDIVYPYEYVGPNFTTDVTSTGLTILSVSLKVRETPDFTVRDRWYHIPEGYISAYKVEGMVADDKGWWLERLNHNYPTQTAVVYKDQEYHFDKNGYVLTSERLNKNGSVIY